MCKFEGRGIFLSDIQPLGIFMHLYLFQKNLYFEVCKFEKKYFHLENIFFAKTIA